MTCGLVRCADKQWRWPEQVNRPEDYGFTVQPSHGLCPKCESAAKAELDRALTVGQTPDPIPQPV